MTLTHIRNWVAEIEVHAKDGDFERSRQLKVELYRELLKGLSEESDDECFRDPDCYALSAEALKAEEFI